MEEAATRFLFGTLLPTRVQHWLRDSGGFRFIVDGSALTLVPLTRPSLVARFLAPAARPTATMAYGAHSAQQVDIFGPRKGGIDGPVVLFVHGGAWGSGSKLQYRLIGARLRRMGLVGAVLGYRVFPMADAAEQAQDVIDALHWLCQHMVAARHHGIFLCGHSSGAHLCATAMLALFAGRNETKVEEDSSNVDVPPVRQLFRGFIGLSGVYDIGAHLKHEQARGVAEISPMTPACGGQAGFAAASPLLVARGLSQRVAGRLPPTLLLHGAADATVGPGASRTFAEALVGRGARARCVVLDGVGHADVIVELMENGTAGGAAQAMARFCMQHALQTARL